MLSVVDPGVTRNIEWVGDKLEETVTPTYSGCPTTRALRHNYARLKGILVRIDASLPVGTDLPPVSRAVLRCLNVHIRRRLILKHPDLPGDVYPADWSGHDCHVLVHGLLDRLPAPAPDDLLS